MRKIAIIGAGQAGFPLAYVLTLKGYQITLYNNRTANEISSGHIMSSQGVFSTALQIEKDWGLNFWENIGPKNQSVNFTLAAPDSKQKLIEWNGITKKPYQSIDQRIKFSTWLKEFENIGGNLIIKEINLNDLNEIAQEHELTIIAGGKKEISQSFARDNSRSLFNTPMRTLACLYVQGMIPAHEQPGVRFNVVPGIGEFFTMPGLTLNGQCEMMLFEGIPGQAFDCWHDVTCPEQQLEMALQLLNDYVPWEAERCKNIQVADRNATLLGRYTPIVRHPTAKLPCGKYILGIGDTVVLNDPIAGQGANNAIKCAKIYIERILAHEQKPFDAAWMQETFEIYWQQIAQWSTAWSNMLLQAPPVHVIDLLQSATRSKLLADTLASGFDNPSSFFPWITDPTQTNSIINNYLSQENIHYHSMAAIN